MRLGELLWRKGNVEEAREKFALAKIKGHSQADERLVAVTSGREFAADGLRRPSSRAEGSHGGGGRPRRRRPRRRR
jgi:hypothetical protein